MQPPSMGFADGLSAEHVELLKLLREQHPLLLWTKLLDANEVNAGWSIALWATAEVDALMLTIPPPCPLRLERQMSTMCCRR